MVYVLKRAIRRRFQFLKDKELMSTIIACIVISLMLALGMFVSSTLGGAV